MRTLCPELGVVSICPDCVKSLLGLMTADERLFGQKMQSSVICAACDPSCGGQELNVWDVRMARIIHQPQLSRYQLYPPLPQTSPTKYLEIRNNTNIIRTELVGSGCKYLLCLKDYEVLLQRSYNNAWLLDSKVWIENDFDDILSFSFHFVVVCLMIYFSGAGLFVRYRSHCSISQLSHLGPWYLREDTNFTGHFKRKVFVSYPIFLSQ